MRWPLSAASCSVMALLALMAVPAWAQTYRPQRPYRGLFGGGAGEAQQQGLVATASVAAGWDDNLVADLTGRNSFAVIGPFSSSGWPSGFTTRPMTASPTGTSMMRRVRRTVSPSDRKSVV